MAILGTYGLSLKNVGRPHVAVREGRKHSRSAVELKTSYLWMRLGQGRKDRAWTFGKIVMGTTDRTTES